MHESANHLRREGKARRLYDGMIALDVHDEATSYLLPC